jgi:hypothetical protein
MAVEELLIGLLGFSFRFAGGFGLCLAVRFGFWSFNAGGGHLIFDHDLVALLDRARFPNYRCLF